MAFPSKMGVWNGIVGRTPDASAGSILVAPTVAVLLCKSKPPTVAIV